MRRSFRTTLFLTLLSAMWHVGNAGECRAQCCDADDYCGELEYCGYYDGCDGCGCDGYGYGCRDGSGHGHGHLHNKLAGAGGCCLCCQKHGWDGQRRISYQRQKDLFYNYYAQPGPFYNTPGKMYVSPLPVPANVGHTYTTYQPYMPHEYLYRHKRAYYTYNPGAGWTRTNVRYGTCGTWCHNFCSDWHYPMTANLWPLNQDFYRPGLQF
jgi:hypothetical protein